MAENGQDNAEQLKHTAGSRPSSAARGAYQEAVGDRSNHIDGGTASTMHWFAYLGPDPPGADEEDRETRLRNLKERQNEERQKKLEEIKAQALAAQRYKEQKELERKQRFDELRQREDARRQQVEERKRAINEAERDRLDAILRRNQEREARIEARKRNDRHSMVFAFGSSTPRMLEPADSTSYGSFWGHRRATSTQNITTSSPAAMTTSAMTPLTRRQSERELDTGSKKRATSAGGLERSIEDPLRMSSSMHEIFGNALGPAGGVMPVARLMRSSSANFGTPPTTPAGCVSGYVGRRRTDLMPTIPLKDPSSAMTSSNGMTSSRSKSFARSPGRAYSMSRLDQLARPRRRNDLAPVLEIGSAMMGVAGGSHPRPLHHHSQPSSVSRSMSHLAVSKLGSSTSSSLSGSAQRTPLRKSDSRSMHQLSVMSNSASGGGVFTPVPPPRATRATQLRQQKLLGAGTSTSPGPVSSAQTEAHSRPSSALSQQSTTSVASSVNMRTRPVATPRRPRPASIAVTGVTTAAAADKTSDKTKPPLPKSRKPSLGKSQEKLKKRPSSASVTAVASPTEATAKPLVPPPALSNPIRNADSVTAEQLNNDGKSDNEIKLDNTIVISQEINSAETKAVDGYIQTNGATVLLETNNMQTENKGAAAVIVQEIEGVQNMDGVTEADIANTTSVNELTDMTASMTKVRITTEEEAKAALAERRRLAREEAERLAEAERLRIEEEERLEFERQQREEEQQRILIEQMRAAEQERLEEAIRETQRREEEERLRKEEELRQKVQREEIERKAREEAERQKVEALERAKAEEIERQARRKRVEAIMQRTRGKNNGGSPQQQTDDKNEENSTNTMNGSSKAENGHNNVKEIDTVAPHVDNIIPVETLKNANTVNVSETTTLSTDDTLNSNNAWQRNNQTTDLLM